MITVNERCYTRVTILNNASFSSCTFWIRLDGHARVPGRVWGIRCRSRLLLFTPHAWWASLHASSRPWASWRKGYRRTSCGRCHDPLSRPRICFGVMERPGIREQRFPLEKLGRSPFSDSLPWRLGSFDTRIRTLGMPKEDNMSFGFVNRLFFTTAKLLYRCFCLCFPWADEHGSHESRPQGQLDGGRRRYLSLWYAQWKLLHSGIGKRITLNIQLLWIMIIIFLNTSTCKMNIERNTAFGLLKLTEDYMFF